ncbi:hypothetical protein [Rheinheimera tangshanensis]|uniref:Uncharacterized protein n=1 Tax=Rheinheimera tangshanensis TaxID=400153 RepID=A0A5C8LV99_9GAMM|nr:hypothetical protein [Rheinheimera tangshanensis]TXK79562.1 hypothetical protein FU839_14555 [Rheinheimera tangshanensis]GGM49995.1 hypothetical protein GCM10010920_07990 [Rheinheimera tangshanensis]
MATLGSLTELYQDCDVFYMEKQQLSVTQQQELLQRICQQTVQLAVNTPFLLISQLSLTPASGLVSSKLFIKQAALLTVIALASRWPEDLLFQLLKSCLLQPLAVSSLIEKSAKAEELSALEQQQLKFPAVLTIKQHKELVEKAGVLNLLHQCYGKNRGLAIWQSPYFSQLISFCWQVTRLMLPGAGSLIALEKISVQLVPQATVIELQFWQALSCLHSCSYSTGRFIRDSEANLALLLCEMHSSEQIQLLVQPYDKSTKQLLPQRILPATDWHLLNPRQYSQDNWLSGWQQENKYLPLWPEPTNLPALSWLQQLSQAAKVSQQAELIEQHPWLMQQLQQKASAQSRQQQKIHSTQHAIAMLGQEQLLPLLKQAWLEQHCQQQHQPLHDWLLEFRRVLAKALYLLTQPIKFYALTVQQAELLAWCLCWPLWQQSDLRFMALSHPTQAGSLISHWLKQQLWQSEHYQQLAVKTLKHLQFNQSWQDACLHYRALPTSGHSHAMAFVLAFAFDLTASVFSDSDDNDRLKHSYKFVENQLAAHLCSAAEWQMLLVEQSQPVTQLIASCSFISPFFKVTPQEATDLSQMSA